MSLRNRARSLQKQTGFSYQQALAKLRALGERSVALARQTGWPLPVCDRFLTDGHAPIDVIELADGPRDPIVALCERVRATANARAVMVAADQGRVLARVGEFDTEALLRCLVPRMQWKRGTAQPLAKQWAELPELLALDDGIVIHTTRFRGGLLVVQFHREESSLGLVRLRAARAVEELDELFDEPKPAPLPPTGRGGPSGAPAEARVAAPPRARAKPKPKPPRPR
jgi:hypothetical protein